MIKSVVVIDEKAVVEDSWVECVKHARRYMKTTFPHSQDTMLVQGSETDPHVANFFKELKIGSKSDVSVFTVEVWREFLAERAEVARLANRSPEEKQADLDKKDAEFEEEAARLLALLEQHDKLSLTLLSTSESVGKFEERLENCNPDLYALYWKAIDAGGHSGFSLWCLFGSMKSILIERG